MSQVLRGPDIGGSCWHSFSDSRVGAAVSAALPRLLHGPASLRSRLGGGRGAGLPAALPHRPLALLAAEEAGNRVPLLSWSAWQRHTRKVGRVVGAGCWVSLPAVSATAFIMSSTI